MTNQHTSGPWELVQDGALNYAIQGGLPYGKGEIATLTNYATHPSGLAYANARLIAAAPELLEVLQDYANLLAQGITLGVQPGSAAHTNLFNLLTKAKGA